MSSKRLSAQGDAFSVEGGRAYLTIPIAEADAILRERRRLAAEPGELPGWSVAKVADVLGIRLTAVHRLRELGKLPAEIEVHAIGGRKRRWRPETVRAYAKRVGRTVAEWPSRHPGTPGSGCPGGAGASPGVGKLPGPGPSSPAGARAVAT